MRSLLTATLALAALALAGCGSSSPAVKGAWILEETGDAVPTGEAAYTRSPVKVLTDTHFAFGRQTEEGAPFAGGGTYSLDGETYTETILYHAHPALVGVTVTFRCRLDGDRWYHSAEFEAGGRRYVIDEVWRRIE